LDKQNSLKERLKENQKERQEFGRVLNEFERDQERFKKLKREGFPAVEDEKLLQAASAWIFEKVYSKGPDKYFEMMATLPKPCQIFYAVGAVDCEVNNGGFNQYYYNLGHEISTVKAEEALDAIGAPQIAEITRKADAVYEQIKDTLSNCMEESTIEEFMDSYDDNPLNEFDDEFAKAYETEDLVNLSIKFIRENIDCFGD